MEKVGTIKIRIDGVVHDATIKREEGEYPFILIGVQNEDFPKILITGFLDCAIDVLQPDTVIERLMEKDKVFDWDELEHYLGFEFEREEIT